MKPGITIVVPTFSDSRKAVTRIPLQRRLWISLKEQVDKDFSVVAVDNCSYDDTEGMFRRYFPDGKFVQHKTPDHRSGARNLGIRSCETSHFICLDCDLLAYPTFIGNVREFIRMNPVSIGFGNCLTYWNDLFLGDEFIVINDGAETLDIDGLERAVKFSPLRSGEVLSRSARLVNELKTEPTPYDSIEFWTPVFAAPKELFLSIGGFDEEFVGYGYEDVHLGYVAYNRRASRFLLNNVMCIHQNHRPPGGDEIHLTDCRNADKNRIILDRKVRALGYRI